MKLYVDLKKKKEDHGYDKDSTYDSSTNMNRRKTPNNNQYYPRLKKRGEEKSDHVYLLSHPNTNKSNNNRANQDEHSGSLILNHL